MQNLSRFKGKTVFVTGGSRGIGSAIVARLVEEGAQVTFTYASSADRATQLIEQLAKQLGSSVSDRVQAVQADSNHADEVIQAVNTAASDMGSLDIFINNVGIYDYALIDDATLDMFDHTINVNVRSAFAAGQAAARHMNDGGRIILLGSINADHINAPGGALYAMSKAALAGLTRGWARDLAQRKITVNIVNPGPIDTETNPKDGPYAGKLKEMIALGDYGEPDDIAALVSFVASEEARFITGATLVCDGGMTA